MSSTSGQEFVGALLNSIFQYTDKE